MGRAARLSRHAQAVLERAALLILWGNFTKPFSENHGGGTPAIHLGIETCPRSLRQLLAERCFPSRNQLPEPWGDYYRRAIDAVGNTHPHRHILRRAL